jgi:DNA-binding PadR family transcriptional regulator
MLEKDLYSGFIRLHILYHASEGPIFGLGIMQELERHGYRLSPGTLYPILHRMEDQGLIESTKELVAGKVRRTYRITDSGQRLLVAARRKVLELFGELFSSDRSRATSHTSVNKQDTEGCEEE